jgi:hypothetical protein
MTNPRYIALSITPLAMRGARARVDRRGAIFVERWAERKWSSRVSRKLTEMEEEIGDFVRDLAGENPADLQGLVTLHPSWVLAKKVALPPAKPKETRQYLQLQAERQKVMLRNGEIVWDCLLGPRNEQGRDGLLVMAKKETVTPVENAFRACGIGLRRVSVSSLEDALCLRKHSHFPQDSEIALVKMEEEGAAVLGMRNGDTALCAWVPFSGSNDDPTARFALFALKLAEQAAGWKWGKTVVWGDADAGRQAARVLSRLGQVEEFGPGTAPREISFAADAGANPAAFPTDLAGLLIRQTRKDAAPFNLTEGATQPLWEHTRFGFLFQKKTAIPLAAALLLGFVLVAAGARRIENALYAKSLKNGQNVARLVEAQRKNVEVLERCAQERVVPLDILLEMTKALPEGMLLSSFRMDKKGQIQIGGNCQSLSQAEQLVANLNKSSVFGKASTERTGAGPKGLTFSIKCALKKKAGK